MYEKIVVPLDGSKLAECVFPYVEGLAQGCGTKEVILISVTEPVIGRTRAPEAQEVFRTGEEARVGKSGSVVTLTLGKKERQAQRYLDRVAKRLQKKEIGVRIKVLLGKPAEEIVSFSEENGGDLIIMASHGRSGPSRWAYGSVAEKVFRASCVPVMMIKAPGCLPGF